MSSCFSRVDSQTPVTASQSLRDLSLPKPPAPETMRRPSGEKAQAVTTSSCPSRVVSQTAVTASQKLERRITASRDDAPPVGREGAGGDLARVPFQDNDAPACAGFPELERLVVARRYDLFPSGEKAQALTPQRARRGWPRRSGARVPEPQGLGCAKESSSDSAVSERSPTETIVSPSGRRRRR